MLQEILENSVRIPKPSDFSDQSLKQPTSANMLKQSQNKKGRKFVSAAPKMVSYLQLAAEKKTTFLVQLTQIFGPSYFDRALVVGK